MREIEPFDLVGIGFGPAGIALAAAAHDSGEAGGVDLAGRVAFFERGPVPGWQTGLLFRNADIQHHYLRDLATPRDPRSRFTFANFLKENDRIYEFGSLVYGGGGGAVSRIEWSDYVAWAARLLDDYVTYKCPVQSVELASVAGQELLKVRTCNGDVLARSVAYCAGQDLNYPQPFLPHVGNDVFHATQFLDKMREAPRKERLRISIVGAGQASIEVLSYLHATYPHAEITGIQRSLGFHHGNHSPFVQRMFHPKESDFFFALDTGARREVLREVARANYAAVDREAVSALYRTLYEDKLVGAERVRFLAATEVVAVERSSDGSLLLATRNRLTAAKESVSADIVILATGFIDRTLPTVFEPLRPAMRQDCNGDPIVNYDYSITGMLESFPAVFIPGNAEPSHGLGSSNSFSMIALKAERVVGALHQRGFLEKRPKQVSVA